MKKTESLPEEDGYLLALKEKARARNELIAAIYASSAADLELAAVAIKAALRGTGPIARPRRFRTLGD